MFVNIIGIVAGKIRLTKELVDLVHHLLKEY